MSDSTRIRCVPIRREEKVDETVVTLRRACLWMGFGAVGMVGKALRYK
jgi:hypothetical protein